MDGEGAMCTHACVRAHTHSPLQDHASLLSHIKCSYNLYWHWFQASPKDVVTLHQRNQTLTPEQHHLGSAWLAFLAPGTQIQGAGFSVRILQAIYFSETVIRNASGEGETLGVSPFFSREGKPCPRSCRSSPAGGARAQAAAAHRGAPRCAAPGAAAPTLAFIRSRVGFFSLREVCTKLAGFISKFQKKSGQWGSVERDRHLTGGPAGDQDHSGTWEDV